ncbi:hypothetical protein AAZX31_05G074700 [Glycine max]|nr:sulfite oxidase isoform X2 [Glycine max]
MLSLLHSVLYLAVLFFLFSVFRNRGFFFTGLVYSFSSYNYYFHDIFQAVFHCVYKIYDSIRFMFQNSKISRTGDDFNYDSIAFIQDLFDYLLGGSWISQSDSGLSFIQELITTQSVLKKRILDLVFLLLCKNVTMLFDDRMLPKYSVTATLQCAGNRRTAMSKIKTVKGVGWDVSAIGNAIWGGAKLSDVLELVGIPKLTSVTRFGGRHVEFISVDKCKEENGGPYKASIPLSQATNPEADVLLAYEMNGEPLNRDHGYPLRVVVPSVIGARSVKWLEDINIIAEECQGLFMQKDYKMFPPSVNWDNIDWSTRRPQMDFPVQCVICSLEDVSTVKPGKDQERFAVQTGETA